MPLWQAVRSLVGYPHLAVCELHADISFQDVFLSRNGYLARLSRVGPFADDSSIVLVVFSAACQQHRAQGEGGEGFDVVVLHIGGVFDGSLFRQRMVSSI